MSTSHEKKANLGDTTVHTANCYAKTFVIKNLNITTVIAQIV